MPHVKYINADGVARDVDLPVGISVMAGAINNDISGIDADCGGALACATCHVYVSPEWADRLPEPQAAETDLLEIVASERKPTSRLSCQLIVSEELDGLEVTIPETQI